MSGGPKDVAKETMDPDEAPVDAEPSTDAKTEDAPVETPEDAGPSTETPTENAPDESEKTEPSTETPTEDAPDESEKTEPSTETKAEDTSTDQGSSQGKQEDVPIIDAHAEHPPEPVRKAEPRKRTARPTAPERPVRKVEPVDYGNSMREIVIDKVVVNMGVGEAGEKILRAKTLLKRLTGQEPIETVSRTTNRDLAIRKGQPIGCKVTLRGPGAEEFLEKALWVKDHQLPSYCFDPEGNCSFGIPDYTEFKDMKYDPDIGIFGMDIATVLKRKGGFRTKHRKLMNRRIPHRHRISVTEGKQFMANRFNIEILEVS